MCDIYVCVEEQQYFLSSESAERDDCVHHTRLWLLLLCVFGMDPTDSCV